MADIATKALTIEEFLDQYGDNPRYELANGELIDMEPTGPHEAVAGKLVAQLNLEISQQSHPWLIPRTCILRSPDTETTARRPDVVVLDETMLGNEPLWEREPVIVLGKSIKLVIEVVSTNWETDYARKAEEYAVMGIPEYWIVDYRGLGGVGFIGRPKQPTFTVCQLVGEDYQRQLYRLGESIHSALLPSIQLRLNDVLP
jgi:Uma2 family endonuclease